MYLNKVYDLCLNFCPTNHIPDETDMECIFMPAYVIKYLNIEILGISIKKERIMIRNMIFYYDINSYLQKNKFKK